MKTLVKPHLKRPSQPKPTPKFWLGINLHSLRMKKGLTQEQLAKMAKISSRRLRDIENVAPDSNPELNTLLAIATALQTDIQVLFKAGDESKLLEV